MGHLFTSGVFMNATPAWHKLGTVIDGTLPAREAFEMGGALFQVAGQPVRTVTGADIPGYKAIIRTDTGEALSVMRSTYEPVQNDRLLRVAEALREDVEMDAVCVLAEGRKVTFTATIRGAEGEVGKGDQVRMNLVGATSHDGTVAFQIMFTPVRVVCANTLAAALGTASGDRVRRIRHTKNANALIARLPEIVDCRRQLFTAGLSELQAMAQTPMTDQQFRDYCETLFRDQITGTVNAKRGDATTARPKRLEDLPAWQQLESKWQGGLIGGDLPAVRGTVWGAYNAISEFFSHDAGRAKDPIENARQRLESLWFGKGAETLDSAHALALAATR